ncbi:hypothetical protein IKE84_02230 [Candidatus Saccharibacteria bacterium]|nr:hypothetical protein [Candidatus Saccharibacteria bacterium]
MKINRKIFRSVFGALAITLCPFVNVNVSAISFPSEAVSNATVDTNTENILNENILSTKNLLSVNNINTTSEEDEEICSGIDLNGTACYDTLSDALSAIATWDRTAQNTITLMSDVVDETTSMYQFVQNVTIDLNGHTLTTARSFYVYATNVSFTGNGVVNFSNTMPINLLGSKNATSTNYTNLTVDSGVTMRSTAPSYSYLISLASNNYLDYKYGITVNYNGKLESAEGTKCLAFFVNGNYKDTSLVINIGSTAVLNVFYGLVASGWATVNFSGVINTTGAGIEMRAGELNINGGGITVAEDVQYEVHPNGSGTTTTGAAVAIAQHTTQLPIAVTISGGEFRAQVPFSEANPQANPDEAIAKTSATISGGTFESYGNTPVISEDYSGFITGGRFNGEINSEMVANDYTLYNIGGYYEVLPTIKTDTKDEVTDDETSDANIAALSEMTDEVMALVISEFGALENNEYELSDGLKVQIEDAATFEQAVREGKTITTALTASEEDVTDSLSDEEKELLHGTMTEDATKVGIFDYSITMTTSDGTVVARIVEMPTELSLSFGLADIAPAEENVDRNYHVVRSHKGSADELNVALSEDGERLQFGSDKFSNFLVFYVETEAEDENILAPNVPDTGVFTGITNFVRDNFFTATLLFAVLAYLSWHYYQIHKVRKTRNS